MLVLSKLGAGRGVSVLLQLMRDSEMFHLFPGCPLCFLIQNLNVLRSAWGRMAKKLPWDDIGISTVSIWSLWFFMTPKHSLGIEINIGFTPPPPNYPRGACYWVWGGYLSPLLDDCLGISKKNRVFKRRLYECLSIFPKRLKKNEEAKKHHLHRLCDEGLLTVPQREATQKVGCDFQRGMEIKVWKLVILLENDFGTGCGGET